MIPERCRHVVERHVARIQLAQNVARAASLIHEQPLPIVVRRDGERRLGARNHRLIAQIYQQIGHIRARQLRPHNLVLRQLRLHFRRVVPHVGHQRDGIGKRAPALYRRRCGHRRTVDSMASRALRPRELRLAARRVPRSVEVVRRIKRREQIGRILVRERHGRHIPRPHRAPHHRRVVPHGRGKKRGSETPVDNLPQIRCRISAAAIQLMALHAAARLKQFPPARRVHGWNRSRRRGQARSQKQKGYREVSHREYLNPVVIRLLWKLS